eukprot:90355_1
MATLIINQIDAGLEQYYLAMGRHDYKNENGQGKFYHWAVDEFGWDDEDIEEDLNEDYDDPDDSIFCTLDEDIDFPFKADIEDAKDRFKAIYDILKYIVANGEAPIPQSHTTHTVQVKIDLFVSEKKAEEIGNVVYKKQLSCINFPEPALMYFFGVGYMHHIPLLTWLVDAYTMDKTKHYKPRNEPLTVSAWADQNRFMKHLERRDRKKWFRLGSAMCAYSNRLFKRLQFDSTPFKIDDDIEEIVNYVSAVPDLLG